MVHHLDVLAAVGIVVVLDLIDEGLDEYELPVVDW